MYVGMYVCIYGYKVYHDKLEQFRKQTLYRGHKCLGMIPEVSKPAFFSMNIWS